MHPADCSYVAGESPYKYAVLRCVDEGGSVYAAKMPLGVLRDLLGLAPTVLVSEEGAARFREELEMLERALEGIGHPHLLRLVDYSEQLYTLVWEYCPFGSLRDALERVGPLPLREAVKAGLQAADALMLLHKSFGCPHSDVKPENLLVDAGRRIKLADFESAAALRIPGIPPRVTRFYAAPEALAGEPRLESDVYSLALTIAELATGYSPREPSGRDLADLVKEKLGEELRSVLLASLKEKPEERIGLEEIAERLWKIYASL